MKRPKYDQCDSEQIEGIAQEAKRIRREETTEEEKQRRRTNPTAKYQRLTELRPDAPPKPGKITFSDHTKEILRNRKRAANEANGQEFDRLTKEFMKSKKNDKR